MPFMSALPAQAPPQPIAALDASDAVDLAVDAVALDGWTDEELMLSYAAGETSSFDMLYARHEGSLYRFVRRLMGVALVAQVDEVFQDTWLRIVDKRASFVPQGAAWRTWAFTIAHNLAMDRLRISGRELSMDARRAGEGDGDDLRPPVERVMEQAADGAPVQAALSAEDSAFWRAAGRRLMTCVGELPADQRAAFLLHQEDGFTVEALAAALDVGFETVRSRLRYGLKKLRACMGPYLEVIGGAP